MVSPKFINIVDIIIDLEIFIENFQVDYCISIALVLQFLLVAITDWNLPFKSKYQ